MVRTKLIGQGLILNPSGELIKHINNSKGKVGNGKGGGSSGIYNYWMLEYVSPDYSTPNTATPTFQGGLEELKFMLSAGAGANAGPGVAIGDGPPSGGFQMSNAFDATTAAWVNSAAPARIGYQFNQGQDITHLAITQRDLNSFDAPWTFLVKKGTSLGTLQTVGYYKAGASRWSGSRETRIIDLVADRLGLTTDLSALDEVGGHRYWAIKPTATFAGSSGDALQREFQLWKGGVNITAGKWHRQYLTGTSNGYVTPFDRGPGNYHFVTLPSGYVLVDLGYKRLPDQLKTMNYAADTRMCKNFDLYYADGAWPTSLASMTLYNSYTTGAGLPADQGLISYTL